MKPLAQPVKSVGGMIDQVTEGATGIVEDAEQKTVSAFGSGDKLLKGLTGGKGSKGESKKEEGGGDFLGTVKFHYNRCSLWFFRILKKDK